MQQNLGVNVRLIDRQQLKELEPDWRVDDVHFAAYEPDSGYGDGACVANDFLNARPRFRRRLLAEDRSHRFSDGKPAKFAACKPQKAKSTPPLSLPPPAHGRALCSAPPASIHRLRTEFHQVAILKNAPIAPITKPGAACIDSVTATYFRSDGSDKFLVGDFYGKRPVDPDNFPQRPTEADLEDIIDRASRRVPKLEYAEVMRGVTGVYDITPDSRPLLGSVPE